MNASTLTAFAAGGLQFVVAAYALRLNRLFGTARVGWSLFCAFTLLALLHVAQILKPVQGVVSLETEVEVIYALVSLLLLTGMVHLETLLKERQRMEQKEQQLRVELEQEVKKKTAYLTRAIEELQAEIDERKRMESAMETTDFELKAASRQIELAGLANSVLHMAGELLSDIHQAVERISSRMRNSKMDRLTHAGSQLQDPATDWERFTERRWEIQKLSQQITELAKNLGEEQSSMLNDLDRVKSKLGKITRMQQNYIKLAAIQDSAAKNESPEAGASAAGPNVSAESDFNTVTLNA